MKNILETGINEANRMKELSFKSEGKLFRLEDRVFTNPVPKDLEERIRLLEDINACILEFRERYSKAKNRKVFQTSIDRRDQAEKQLAFTVSMKDFYK